MSAKNEESTAFDVGTKDPEDRVATAEGSTHDFVKPDTHLKENLNSYAEKQRAVNRSRPRENGVSGSVGMFTGINVSALKGSDILDILRRAETGEKIKFQ